MSLATVSQFCKHPETVAKNNAFQFAGPGIASSFNLVLAEAKKDLQDAGIVQGLAEATENNRLGDLLVRAGLILSSYQEDEPIALGFV